MAPDILLLLVGIAMLVGGGRTFVDGASRLAEAIGVSELAIGLTVVAFGTSAPELAVNMLAAARGDGAIAFGNIIGSNMANIALVLGISAMVRPLRMESMIVSREIPMMLLATMATVILGLDRFRGQLQSYDRSDGLMLLLLFSVFLYYSVSEVLLGRSRDPVAQVAGGLRSGRSTWAAGRSLGLAAAGLVVLLIGAQATIAGAVSLAQALDIPRSYIGLTVIAFGTSLPEMTTSLVATLRGQASLAVGNVVGSNIFNLLFILGTTAVIRPVEVPVLGGTPDLAALVAFSIVLLPLSRARGARILRWHGAVLVLSYLAYLAWRLVE